MMVSANPLFKSQPVSRIPNELLCEVFLYARSACGLHVRVLVEAFYAKEGRITDDLLALWGPHRWITLSHVCRLWRNVAISCPRLWSQIIVTANDDRIAAFLQRSQRFPLAFFKSPVAEQPISQYVGILNAHLDRTIFIESLKIGTGDSEVLGTAADDVELPLESINMSATAGADFIPVISSAKFPRLRRVYVATASYSAVRNLLRPSLTSLTLTGLSAPPSTEDWLSLLRGMPALEELYLVGAILPQDSSIVTLPPSKRVRLDNLHSIKLMDDDGGAFACGNFANNLVFPCTTNMVLGTYDPLPTNPHIPVLQTVFQRFAPTKIIFQCFSGTDIHIYATGVKNLRETGFIIILDYRDYALGFISNLFSGLHLPSAVSFILGSGLPSGQWPQGALAAMNASLPNVTRLQLTGTETATMFIEETELLMDEDTRSETSQDTGTGTKAESPPLFANLAELVLSHVVWDEEYVGPDPPELAGRLVSVAGWRHEVGLTIPLLLLERAVHLSNIADGPISNTVGRCIINQVHCGDYGCPCTDIYPSIEPGTRLRR